MSAALEPPAGVATFVCPHLDVAHRPGTNLVWSAGLTLGWKQLIERAGGPIELLEAHPGEPAAELVRALNQSAAELGAVPPGICAGWTGYASQADPIAIIGNVTMHPQFRTPFPRSRRPMPYGQHWVEGFGLWYDEDEPVERWEQRGAQVIVHFPRCTDEELPNLPDEEQEAAWEKLAVEFLTTDPAMRLIVANTGRGSTLRGTVEQAMTYVHEGDDGTHPMARLSRQEGLCLPVVNLRCEAASRDVFACSIANAPLRGKALGELRQTVQVHFDGGGPTTFSTMRNPFGGALMSPRRWYAPLPWFLLLLIERRTRMPLLAGWFENGSAFLDAPDPIASIRKR